MFGLLGQPLVLALRLPLLLWLERPLSGAELRLQLLGERLHGGALLYRDLYDGTAPLAAAVAALLEAALHRPTLLYRLLALALPRIRDFRGLSDRQFDGRGNYTFGLTEQVMFHEIDQDKIDRSRGMDITVVTSATNDDEGRALLKKLGFPFKENN